MTEPYLIAHKVRGEPAFDVAIRMECPHCEGAPDTYDIGGCYECDGLGYWWIIPTSGHRAYPWWSAELRIGDYITIESIFVDPMPDSLPDHYPTKSSPRTTLDLASALGLVKKPAPMAPIKRRL